VWRFSRCRFAVIFYTCAGGENEAKTSLYNEKEASLVQRHHRQHPRVWPMSIAQQHHLAGCLSVCLYIYIYHVYIYILIYIYSSAQCMHGKNLYKSRYHIHQSSRQVLHSIHATLTHPQSLFTGTHSQSVQVNGDDDRVSRAHSLRIGPGTKSVQVNRV
jgi:hypothetical protein